MLGLKRAFVDACLHNDERIAQVCAYLLTFSVEWYTILLNSPHKYTGSRLRFVTSHCSAIARNLTCSGPGAAACETSSLMREQKSAET